jgi:hypothetical protein
MKGHEGVWKSMGRVGGGCGMCSLDPEMAKMVCGCGMCSLDPEPQPDITRGSAMLPT